MSWVIDLGEIVNAAASGPATRAEMYQRAKGGCSVQPCRSCSGMFGGAWRLARRLELIVPAPGRKFMLRGWNEQVAEALGVWS